MKGTKEFYEIQNAFEKYIMSDSCPVYIGAKITRAPKDAVYFYENGNVNSFFQMFMSGYGLGRLNYMN